MDTQKGIEIAGGRTQQAPQHTHTTSHPDQSFDIGQGDMDVELPHGEDRRLQMSAQENVALIREREQT